MKKHSVIAAIAGLGLVAASSAFAASNTVYLNQTGDNAIAIGVQDSGSTSNALSIIQNSNQYANTYQVGSGNTINSNQSSGAYNFLGAPDSYMNVSAGTVNGFLANAGVPFSVAPGPFVQSGENNTLNNTQSGRAGLVQGSQSGTNGTISTVQTGDANGLSVNQGGGDRNTINSYQGGFEIAVLRQNGSNNTINGSQSGNGTLSVNSALVTQDGNWHQASYTQSGSGNALSLTQTGVGNSAALNQNGVKNSATVTQR